MLISCGGSNSETAVISEKSITESKDASQEPIEQEEYFISDTIARFSVDDYPVRNEMFFEKINPWFRNDTLKQALAFDLYTDHHRMYTYHFYENDVPSELLTTMKRNFLGGESANGKINSEYLKKNLDQSIKISSHYFTTNKGIRLGDTKRKAIGIYGEPDEKTISNQVEKFEWNFFGETNYNGKTELKNKLLAEHSFGHQIVMYFKNDKLVGQILYNAVP